MGEVYEVEHTTLDRRFALKLLPQDFTSRCDALERFRREARKCRPCYLTLPVTSRLGFREFDSKSPGFGMCSESIDNSQKPYPVES